MSIFSVRGDNQDKLMCQFPFLLTIHAVLYACTHAVCVLYMKLILWSTSIIFDDWGRQFSKCGNVSLSVYAALIITPPPMGELSNCNERVCLCVCPIISLALRVRSSPIFVHATYGRGSVLLWRRSDMLYTSGFMNDDIFAHKPRLLDVAAQLKRSAHAASGLAINCAQ